MIHQRIAPSAVRAAGCARRRSALLACRPRAPARRAADRSRQRVQRLALPPDQLHPGRASTPREFLQIMGTRVGRSTLFGIPLQQQWSYANSGDFAPTYYLQSDAPLYYYSFTDAYIAMRLPLADAGRAGALRSDDHRLQSGRHVRRRSHPPRAARRSPACSRASASSRIHKEFVSSKVAGRDGQPDEPGARPHPRLRRPKPGSS